MTDESKKRLFEYVATGKEHENAKSGSNHQVEITEGVREQDVVEGRFGWSHPEAELVVEERAH